MGLAHCTTVCTRREGQHISPAGPQTCPRDTRWEVNQTSTRGRRGGPESTPTDRKRVPKARGRCHTSRNKAPTPGESTSPAQLVCALPGPGPHWATLGHMRTQPCCPDLPLAAEPGSRPTRPPLSYRERPLARDLPPGTPVHSSPQRGAASGPQRASQGPACWVRGWCQRGHREW